MTRLTRGRASHPKDDTLAYIQTHSVAVRSFRDCFYRFSPWWRNWTTTQQLEIPDLARKAVDNCPFFISQIVKTSIDLNQDKWMPKSGTEIYNQTLWTGFLRHSSCLKRTHPEGRIPIAKWTTIMNTLTCWRFEQPHLFSRRPLSQSARLFITWISGWRSVLSSICFIRAEPRPVLVDK